MEPYNLSHMHKLLSDPDTLTDGDLLKITLSTLSKNLSQTLSGREIISTYMRWLEIHRQNPSRITEHWMNTTQQWVQSLRSRGFSQSELIYVIDSWKKTHGTTQAPYRLSKDRSLPMTEDIVKSFQIQKVDGNRPKEFDDRHGRPVNDFQGPPPGNYVCNRCGKKGHHLQVCPTNLDPAYDKPPGNTYTCTICHLKGKHYRSLCPRNTDSNSITQKRKAQGISVEEDPCVFNKWDRDGGKNDTRNPRPIDLEAVRLREESLCGASPEYVLSHTPPFYALEKRQMLEERKLQRGRGDSVGLTDTEMALNTGSENFTSQKRVRPQSSTPSRSSNDGSPTPDKKQSLRKRIRRIEGYEGKLASGKRLESTQIEMIRRKAVIQEELKTLDENDYGQMDQEYEDNTQFNLRFRGASVSSQASGLQAAGTLSPDPKKMPTKNIPATACSTFIQKLYESRGDEMGEIVNEIKRRPTALDMWEEEDRCRQLQMAPISQEELPDPFWEAQYSPIQYEYNNMFGARLDTDNEGIGQGKQISSVESYKADKARLDNTMSDEEPTTGRLTPYDSSFEQSTESIEEQIELLLAEERDKDLTSQTLAAITEGGLNHIKISSKHTSRFMVLRER